jgi:predicted dehydrogenase
MYDIALVGCGAIAQGFYLPAIARRRREFGKLWLVDPNDRVLNSAASIVDGETAHAISEISDDLTLAIIAAPNSFHYLLAREALARRAHVLIEKPFVIIPDEGRTLIDAAAASTRTIAINQTRRFMPYARDLRRNIETGEFGSLKSVIHYEGQKLSWPFESGAGFQRSAKRTGVIMDLGVHVIDFYEYLFQPKWRFVSARHDGFHGPEGLAEIELEADGAPVLIRLSRYQKQANVAHLFFEHAEILINVDGLNTYVVRYNSGSVRHVTASPTVASYELLADEVLANFLAAVVGREKPVCAASASMPVIEVLDDIYRSARCYSDVIGAV